MTTRPDDALQQLQQEIRAAAEQLAPPPAADSRRRALAPDAFPVDHPQRLRYALDDFLHVHNEEFAELAYRCLLKRPPDPGGQLLVLQRLAAGDSKIAILGDLRDSAEGRGYGVEVRGLNARYRFWRLCRLPVIGGLIERCALLLSLPEIAREQRRLGQALARDAAAAEVADLAAEVAHLRAEVAALRGAQRDQAP